MRKYIGGTPFYGMKMCVTHLSCLKYAWMKELKTDFHILCATELFYLYATIRETGKITTENVRHLQSYRLKKSLQNLCFGAGFRITPRFYFRYQRTRFSEIYLLTTHMTSVSSKIFWFRRAKSDSLWPLVSSKALSFTGKVGTEIRVLPFPFYCLLQFCSVTGVTCSSVIWEHPAPGTWLFQCTLA